MYNTSGGYENGLRRDYQASGGRRPGRLIANCPGTTSFSNGNYRETRVKNVWRSSVWTAQGDRKVRQIRPIRSAACCRQISNQVRPHVPFVDYFVVKFGVDGYTAWHKFAADVIWTCSVPCLLVPLDRLSFCFGFAFKRSTLVIICDPTLSKKWPFTLAVPGAFQLRAQFLVRALCTAASRTLFAHANCSLQSPPER